jgi:hypothetical protein
MPILKLLGQKKVSTVKKTVRSSLGVDIKIYDTTGVEASENSTLGSIRTKAPEEVEIRFAGQALVENVEKLFFSNFGIKVQILDSDGGKADGEMTLAAVRRGYLGNPTNSEVIDPPHSIKEALMVDNSGDVEYISYCIAQDVMDNDNVVGILDAFCDKVMERGTLTNYVGVGDFDFFITVIKSEDLYMVAADIWSENEQFESSRVDWGAISLWVVEELTERDFFLVLDDVFGIDAYSERAVCMSGGEVVNDWGYLSAGQEKT